MPKKTSTTRLWLYRIIAIFLIPLFVLLGAEYTLRLLNFGYPTEYLIPGNKPNQVRTNQKFGWRFFPPAIARKPALFMLQTPKPKDTFRIFILGGSAALGVPQPAFNFGRVLESMLKAQNPQVNIEVVNAAMVAINSHVVLPIIKECAQYEPDLFIVYMGNNEVVGPFGAGSIFGNQTANLASIRLGLWLRSWRLGQATDHLIQKFSAGPQAQSSWQGMKMFLGHHIPQNDPRLQTVYHNFEQNLTDITRATNNTPMLLCTVGVNLTDCAPFASVSDTTLTSQQKNTWTRAYENGIAERQNGNTQQALSHFLQAQEIDANHADLQFQIAQCFAHLHDQDNAHKYFLAARDHDALRFRADTKLNTIIQQVADQHAHVQLVDIDQTMRANNTLPGRDQFYEHVHLTFEGNHTIAKSLYNRVLPLLPQKVAKSFENQPALSREEAAEKLVFTPWAQYQSRKKILGLTNRPPFTYQSNYFAQRNQNLDLLKQLRRTSQTTDVLQATQKQLENATRQSPNDIYFRQLLADVYTQHQPPQIAKAQQQVQHALSLYPDDTNLLTFSAELHEHQQHLSRALEHYEQILQIDPSKTHARLSIAHIKVQQNDIEAAHAHYQSALKQAPHDHVVLTHYGDFLHTTQKYKASLDIYRTGLGIAQQEGNHEYQGIYHQKLGAFFQSQQNTPTALNHYAQAITTFNNAAYPAEEADTHQQVGHIYFSMGQIEQARDHFEKALRILQSIESPAQIRTLTNIGNLYIHQKRYAQALHYHQQAANISAIFQNTLSEANALTNIGICHINIGNIPEARQALQTAQNHYQKMHDYPRVQQTQSLLSQIAN